MNKWVQEGELIQSGFSELELGSLFKITYIFFYKSKSIFKATFHLSLNNNSKSFPSVVHTLYIKPNHLKDKVTGRISRGRSGKNSVRNPQKVIGEWDSWNHRGWKLEGTIKITLLIILFKAIATHMTCYHPTHYQKRTLNLPIDISSTIYCFNSAPLPFYT